MISFREVTEADARMILDWRRQDRVTDFMITDVADDMDAHRAWMAASYERPDYYHWIVQYDGRDVGFLNLANFRPDAEETSWGFYIGVQDAKGVGRKIPPCFHNFAFRQLGVKSVCAQVFYTNTRTIQLHLSHGYRFDPALDHVITKNGDDILMVALRLQKDAFYATERSAQSATLPVTRWAHRHLVRADG